MPTTRKTGRAEGASAKKRPRCGLCGKAGKLKKTACCGQWTCDDEDKYVIFSYARNSCARNHRRYTLCGHHEAECHEGKWQTCKQCRDDFPTEMYVWYGTNEYNFEKLANPPTFAPTHCAGCQKVIRLAVDGYTIEPGGGTYCTDCVRI
jgi:hypothetical protein